MTSNFNEINELADAVSRRKSDKNHLYSTQVKLDIETLGDILGQVIKEQEGLRSFELVEKIRHISIQSRIQGSKEFLDELFLIIRHLNAQDSVLVSRAFGHFLNLVNIAESIHGIDIETPTESVLSVIENALKAGVNKTKIHKVIEALSIELVLTAHPTEVKRRTLIRKHNQITSLIKRRGRTDSEYEKINIDRKLHAVITNLWLTDEIRRKRPTPIEEAKWGCAVIEESLWHSVPLYFRRFNHALSSAGLPELGIEKTPIKLGSWMGGDRDGNPFVTAKTTEEVVMLFRWRAFALILTDINDLIQDLSINVCSHEIKEATNGAHEPYRALLRELRDKLEFTVNWYKSRIIKRRFRLDSACVFTIDEILDPLYLVYNSLKQNNASSIASDSVEDIIHKVHTFGIHLVKLDIRQESTEHTNVMAQIYTHLGLGDYHALTEDEKINWLTQELQSKRPLFADDCIFDEMGQEVVNTFTTIAMLPEDQFGSYVISMASDPSDILSVVLLQKTLGIKKPLPVVPLFETLDDLKGSAKTMDRLFAIDWYRAHCQAKQEVMIGYSDSAKDAGKLAASWQLYQAQKEITDIANRYDVKLCFFHGRGGSVGRGGGPIQSALLSQPPNTVNGRIKITEQGEVIHKKFGSMKTTQQNLMLYTSSVLHASLTPPVTPKESWVKLMESLSVASTKDYRSVVRNDKVFLEYFATATPSNELGRLCIGSRPAKRKKQVSLSALRAIPWIFAWTQTRLMLPSWLGMESAFESVLEKEKKTLKEMVAEWPFFDNLIDLLNMTLLKSDINISHYYDENLSKSLSEYGNFLRDKLQSMLAVNDVLQSFIEKGESDESVSALQYRSPYVDPLNLIQAHVMQKMHALNEKDLEYKNYEDALMLTIAGIAAGMKNTG